jgi:hypothetical protein
MYRLFVVAGALALVSCASHTQPSAYSRADGRPVEASGVQLALAQCKGEVAATVPPTEGGGLGYVAISAADRSSREHAILDACMARNGYLRS